MLLTKKEIESSTLSEVDLAQVIYGTCPKDGNFLFNYVEEGIKACLYCHSIYFVKDIEKCE